MPGGILTAVLLQLNAFDHVKNIIPPLTSDVERWAAFILAAYALGHLVFMASSLLDNAYNPVRPLFNKNIAGDAYNRATELRYRVLGGHDDLPMNTFKWANALLIQRCPLAAAAVHRLEADSKFFRSLVFNFGLISFAGFIKFGCIISLGSFLVGAAAFARYAQQRYKSTQLAYNHVIVYYSLLVSATPDAFDDRRAAPPVAAGDG
jgi:hypothetical protein